MIGSRKMLFKLAAKNVSRNRKRTIITLLGLVLSIGILLFSQGLLSGLGSQSERNLINYQTSHLQISLPGYFEKQETFPLDYLWPDSEGIQEGLAQLSEIEAVTPRLTFTARLSDGTYELPCLGVGIELVGTDDKVFQLRETVVAGRYLEAGDEGLLLGSGLASLFEVERGEFLTLIARTRFEALEALDLPILGIINSGNPQIDKNLFFVPLQLAQKLIEAEGEITEIAVRLTGAEQDRLLKAEKSIKTILASQSQQHEVASWKVLASDYIKMHSIKRKGNVIFLGLLVIISALGIANTMVISTFERTREIGMLMALGLAREDVLRVILIEGTLIGGLGSLLGCLWGGLTTYYFAVKGMNLEAMYGDMDIIYPVKDMLYCELTTPMLLSCLFFGLAVSLLASFLPALSAARLNPAEALRCN